MEQLIIPGTPGFESILGHWHIGSNMVGYLPEGDVYCADNLEQAVEFFGSKLQEARDEAEDECANPMGNDDHLREWRELGDEIEKLMVQMQTNELHARVRDNGGFGYIFTPPEGADISYWLNPVGRTRMDEAAGRFSRADICEIHMEQNDMWPFEFKAEAQTASHCYWGPGHYFIHADKTIIGMTSKDDMGYWWAYTDYLPPTPDKDRECVGKSLLTRDEAVRSLWVHYQNKKRGA